MKIHISDKRGIPVGVFRTLEEALAPKLTLPHELSDKDNPDRWITMDELDVELEIFNLTRIRGCRWSEIYAADLPQLRERLIQAIHAELLKKNGLKEYLCSAIIDSPEGEPKFSFKVEMAIPAYRARLPKPCPLRPMRILVACEYSGAAETPYFMSGLV